MDRTDTSRITEHVRRAAQPLTGAANDYDPLLRLVGDARYVLLGEASHGTHEFYAARAAITRRLIDELGFTAAAVEADWPDAYRVNRNVRGTGDGATAIEALSDFQRFPTWMWRNADMLDFVGWLRERNADMPERARTGFYRPWARGPLPSGMGVNGPLPEGNLRDIVRVFARALNPCVVGFGRVHLHT